MQEKESKQNGYEWLLSRDPEAAEVLSKLNDGSPELVDLLIKSLYEELYQRERLDLKTRLLLTIACAAASGATPQVCYQSRLAMLSGVEIEDIYEVLFHVAVFAGFSNAMNAMNAIKDAASTIVPKDQSE